MKIATRPWRLTVLIGIMPLLVSLGFPADNAMRKPNPKSSEKRKIAGDPSILTLDRIFGSDEFKGDSSGQGRWIELRHLPILGHRVYIRLRPKRYKCPHCGDKTTTQTLDWYDTKSPHTKAYDRYLMLLLINSTVEDVSRKEDIGYGGT